ncbi:hypothetical protein [Bacillus sp. CHD6a]|uniref:hypothetical protein n=1 Tax=Bacillus sp. CHD6a TaxID=1643452 RepID=UPI0006CD6775|nr:hypothetical protein [Bacillus sp. CHD6a]KPB04726.1 hypothetical protein AAV98_10450 [Bacillus sp. CHD6a]
MRRKTELINIEGENYKECTKCGSIKKFEEYSNDKKGKFGKQSACKLCKAAQDKEYRKNNADKVSATSKRYVDKNKETVREMRRKYREANKVRIAAQLKEYNEKNKKRLKEYRRKYYQENKEVQNEKARKYYEENKLEILEQHKIYYRENKEAIDERNKTYRIKNYEEMAAAKRLYTERNAQKIAAYKKQWQKENAQSIRESRRQYRKENAQLIKERKRKYYEENPHVKLANNQRRRAKIKRLPNDLTAEQALKVKKHFGNCAISKIDEDTHLDHFICLATGYGGTTISNMLPIAASLNISKNYFNPFDWVQRRDVAAKLDKKKWLSALKYLGELNEMTIKEYREYVNYCYSNPRDLTKVTEQSN